MTLWSDWLAFRLAELLWHSTALLAVVSLLLPWIQQPARRMIVCRAALAGLVVLALLPGIRGRTVIRLPDWAGSSGIEMQPAPLSTRHEELESPAAASGILVSSSLDETLTLADGERGLINSEADHDLDFAQFRMVPGDCGAAETDTSSMHGMLAGEMPEPSKNLHAAAALTAHSATAMPWTSIASAGWAAGALLATTWIAVGAVRTRRLLQCSRRAPEWIHRALRLVVSERRRPPQLKVTDRIESALACGTWRPAILLPERKAIPPQEDMDPSAIHAVLAHEWAHIVNGDLWLLALERLLLPVYFAQPLFWHLRRRIRIDQELLADAAAAGESPVEYAAALLLWAKTTSAGPRGEVLAVLSFWNNPCHLSRRIEMLLDTTNRIAPQVSRLWRGTMLTIVFALACGVSLITIGTTPSAAENTPGGTAAADSAGNKEPAQPAPAIDAPDAAESSDLPGIDARPAEDSRDEEPSGPVVPDAEVAGPAPAKEVSASPAAAAQAAAEADAIRAGEKYSFTQRLGRKGYISQQDVEAARYDLERAKATLEALQKKAAEPSENESDAKPAIGNAAAQEEVARARERYEFVQRLAKKGYTSQHEVEAARAALEKAKADVEQAKAVLEVAQKKAEKPSDVDELRKLVEDLRGEIRSLRDKLPKEDSSNPADKNSAGSDDRSVELKLLELDVTDAEVDVTAAKLAYEEMAELNAKQPGTFPVAEVHAKKLSVQKTEIALKRAQLRLEAAKPRAPKSGDRQGTPNQKASAIDKPADSTTAASRHRLMITVTSEADGQITSLNVGSVKVCDGPLNEERLLRLDHALKEVFASATERYDSILVQASKNVKREELRDVTRVCMSQISSDGTRVKSVTVVDSPPVSNKPADSAGKPVTDAAHSLTITITAAANGQVASVTVGMAKLFHGPLDENGLRMLDRRLKDVFAIEGQPCDVVVLRAPRNLKYEELIKIINVCHQQKGTDGKPIKALSFVELDETPKKPGDDGAAKQDGSSRIPGLSDLPVVGPLFDKQNSPDAAKPKTADDTPGPKDNGAGLNAPAKGPPAASWDVLPRVVKNSGGQMSATRLLEPVVPARFPVEEEDRVLAQWEATTAKIRRLEVEFTRYVYDAGSQVETRSEGIIALESPFRAAYMLVPTEIKGHVSKKIGKDRSPFTLQTESHEHGWLWAGQDIVHLDSKSRTFESSRIPAEGALKTPGFEFLLAKPFLLGMPAAELRERFDVTLIRKSGNNIWLNFAPRQTQQTRTFGQAILILNSETWLPRALKLTDDSGLVETVHTFQSFRLNGPPTSGVAFEKPDLAGQGFAAVPAPQTGSPPHARSLATRVILPSVMEDAALLAQRRLGLAVDSEPVRQLGPNLAGRLRGGLKVTSVEKGGPADAAGIRIDDVLVGIHVWETARHQDLNYALTNWQPTAGQTAAGATGALRISLVRGTEALTADVTPRQ